MGHLLFRDFDDSQLERVDSFGYSTQVNAAHSFLVHLHLGNLAWDLNL